MSATSGKADGLTAAEQFEAVRPFGRNRRTVVFHSLSPQGTRGERVGERGCSVSKGAAQLGRPDVPPSSDVAERPWILASHTVAGNVS